MRRSSGLLRFRRVGRRGDLRLHDGQPRRHTHGDFGRGRFVGQREQERYQVCLLLWGEGELADFVVLQGHIKPQPASAAPCIEVQHLLQRLEHAVVHVGRSERDIAQGGNFERAVGTAAAPALRFRLGDIGGSIFGVGYANHLEVAVGEHGDAVALVAARLGREEQLQSALLLRAERAAVARRVAVKARIETYQRALERRNRVSNILKGNRFAVRAPEGFVEQGAIFGDGFQLAHEFGRVGVHLFGRSDDHARLLFEVRGASVPELAVVIDSVPQAGCAPREFDAACALASRAFTAASQ
jgi:hypothetical protein